MSCQTGKVCHKTQLEAQVALAYLKSHHERYSLPSARPLHEYRCSKCGDFHLGRSPGWIKRLLTESLSKFSLDAR